MARKVDRLPVKAKYPWTEWFDGDAWELTRGEDFDPVSEQFGRSVYAVAQRRHIRVRVSVQGDKVYLQAMLNGQADGVPD